MNYEIFGIYVTIAVVACLCGFIGIASSDFDITVGEFEIKLPNITSSTSTDIQKDGFYDYCYRMGLDC